ncbi:helix-turn-helix domain-containing protein [Thorsellia anophelis]|uniref:Helix-turn-helix n=1 Tax=Thorsellia anophelis DSM 18579 TaxID=1123402 RepID=A0A1I0CJ36_9GAMM|nr:helix-turn-helix transcriptional regulator [Thorsellia anophelis]SET19454.1 hypothetical protein SAMN02583745_01630 [Thorsellia anophelis DSM 18579]
MKNNNHKISLIPAAALQHFATLLNIARKEKNFTIEDLCSRVNTSKPTMIKILKGDSTVKIGNYFETAWILDVPLFEPEPGRFAEKKRIMEKIDALLPARILPKKEIIDDNF